MRIQIATAVAIALFSQPVQAKDPSTGATTYTLYEGFMSPAQQPGEETDAPKLLAKSVGLESSQPSIPREQRQSRGYGQLRFSRDLTRAYVEVEIKGVNPADILMFHVHCGPPGVLGPIVVDFGEFGSLSKAFTDGISRDIWRRSDYYASGTLMSPSLAVLLAVSCAQHGINADGLLHSGLIG